MEKKKLISVFTPTYNRKHTLERLYNSLISQTSKDFEWIIVDDGSTDGTEELIASFLKKGVIKINYIKQINKGKHIAINYGLKNAEGNYFFVLDSDDYLLPNAIHEVEVLINKIDRDKSIAGFTFIRSGENIDINNIPQIGKEVISEDKKFSYQWGFTGEMTFCIKTEIHKEFLYPETEGEKFCPESLVFKRIAKKYKFLFYIKVLALGNYLPDGLTSKYWQLIMNSPKNSMLFYSELINYVDTFDKKYDAAQTYLKIALASKESKIRTLSKINIFYTMIFFLEKLGKKLRIKNLFKPIKN